MDIEIKLINKCIKNDRIAQRSLYTTLLPYLNVVAKRYLYQDADRQDVLQEAFINIFKSIDKFDSERSQFKTWATKITINCCLKNNYKQQKIQTIAFDSQYHGRLIGPEVLDKLSNDDLIRFIKTMPLPLYEVFSLFIIDGFKHKEIGEMLGIDVNLSRKRLSRGRVWIEEKIGERYLKTVIL